ncbi:hypothetical protein POUND7_008431 [Theobroma cacao]
MAKQTRPRLSSRHGMQAAATKFNVLAFGAKPNGKTDSTKGFFKAWNAACGSADSTMMYVPKWRYLLGSMAFKGDCKSPQITIRIDGTLVAPGDYSVLGKSANWLSFEGVSGVSIIGGALDAKGPALWACKASRTNCPSGATYWKFSQGFERGRGPKCYSKKDNILCTQNGLRIKSWARPSNGFVQGVRFMDSVMRNVQNPTVVDQNYCPHNPNCPDQVLGIKIRDIVYEGIRGTSSTLIAIKFDCSAKQPCIGIRLQNVNLAYLNKTAQSSCSNVVGKAFDLVRPNSCFVIMEMKWLPFSFWYM